MMTSCKRFPGFPGFRLTAALAALLLLPGFGAPARDAVPAPTAAAPASAQTRLATVSVQKVFDNFWKTKQGEIMLKEKWAETEKSNKEMVDSWKKDKDEYQRLLESASDQAVSSAEREKRKKAAEDKLSDLKRTEDNITVFQRQATAKINDQKSQMRKKIFDEIKTVITSKAKAAGYTLVVDADAQTIVPDPAGAYAMPTVLFNSGENDLTDSVLAQLNATAPPDLSTPDGKGEPAKDAGKPATEEKKADSKPEKK